MISLISGNSPTCATPRTYRLQTAPLYQATLPDPVVTLADFRLGLEVEYLCPKNFLFEPGLEPGISQRTLVELRVRNIRLIYFTTGARECRPTEQQDTPPLIRFYGFDQSIECPSAK